MLLGLVVCEVGGPGLPRLGDPGRSPRPAACPWETGLMHNTEGCYVFSGGSASKLTVPTGTCKRIGTTDRRFMRCRSERDPSASSAYAIGPT